MALLKSNDFSTKESAFEIAIALPNQQHLIFFRENQLFLKVNKEVIPEDFSLNKPSTKQIEKILLARKKKNGLTLDLERFLPKTLGIKA